MSIAFEAEVRGDLGTRASRRLRHMERVPAVVYGPGQESLHVSLAHAAVIKHVNDEPFHTQPLELKLGSKKVSVRVQKVQRHKIKPSVMHIDFVYA